MQVTINNVSVEWGGKPPKKWGKAVVEYSYNGQARKQNVMSFSNPEVFKKVQEMVGQTVDVEVGKNDKDFTEWRSIAPVGAASSGTSVTIATGSKTNTYQPRDFETKEERARRQVLIVKQSSLAQAVEIAKLANPKGGPVDLDELKRTAQSLTDWVLEAPAVGSIEDMPDDIPF
jgi:hypothetical protein